MATSVVIVPAGTTSATIPVTPLCSILAGPAVLGGTATLNFSNTMGGPFNAWSFGASANPQSFRPSTNGYIQVAAATQVANVAISDMGGAVGDRAPASLASINCAFASASSTAAQVISSVRIPPGVLPLNGRLRFTGFVSMTNGAGTKDLKFFVNGSGGTQLWTIATATLASQAEYGFQIEIALRGDGVTQNCSGALLTGLGLGVGAASVTYSTLNYQQNELEYCLVATKGTAGDTMTCDSMLCQLL